MSMIDCIMCVTNEGTFDRGRFEDGIPWTIDNITLKMASGKRLRRYSVCVNGCWSSNDLMSLREARAKVSVLREHHKKFVPVTAEEMLQIAKESGAECAYNILLIGGYDFFAGTCREYEELLKEFERGKANGNGSAETGNAEV